jgi:hypothetical protein
VTGKRTYSKRRERRAICQGHGGDGRGGDGRRGEERRGWGKEEGAICDGVIGGDVAREKNEGAGGRERVRSAA